MDKYSRLILQLYNLQEVIEQIQNIFQKIDRSVRIEQKAEADEFLKSS